MPRLLRPHIPLAVRVQVARRQLIIAEGNEQGLVALAMRPDSTNDRLRLLLLSLFGDKPCHLDHDPPLGARKKVFKRGVHVGYEPPANDPKHLVYREAVAHRVKTLIRGEHGQYPDRVLIKRNRRLERKGRPKPKPKRSIPSRPFQKTSRKIPSRPLRRQPP